MAAGAEMAAYPTPLQKLHVVLHVSGVHHVVDQHQPANDITNRRSLVRIDNTAVLQPVGMQPQKVIILGKQDPSLVGCELQVLEVGRAAHIRLRDGQHIDAAAAQPAGYRTADILIGVEPDRLNYVQYQAAISASLEGV